MTNEELKQFVESNARTAQAILDTMAEARQERQDLRQGMVQIQNGMVQLQNSMVRLTNVQEGITKLLASLDEDRPTILRRLMAIENKGDRLLERE